MSNKLSPETIATLAMELTKQISSVEHYDTENQDKYYDAKKFYFELYTECYNHIKSLSPSEQ